MVDFPAGQVILLRVESKNGKGKFQPTKMVTEGQKRHKDEKKSPAKMQILPPNPGGNCQQQIRI